MATDVNCKNLAISSFLNTVTLASLRQRQWRTLEREAAPRLRGASIANYELRIGINSRLKKRLLPSAFIKLGNKIHFQIYACSHN